MIIGCGGLAVDRDIVTIGTVAAFVLYLNNLFEPVQQLSQLYNTVQSAGAALSKIVRRCSTLQPTRRGRSHGAVDLPARSRGIERRPT